jgi:hypothetical protein
VNNDLDRAERRARQYWYDDGLNEIALGCVGMAVGILFLAEAVGLLGSGASSIGLVAVVFLGVYLARGLVRVGKERITYPRTGFVRYRRPVRAKFVRLAAGASAAVVAATVVALLQRVPESLTLIPALDGIVIGAAFFYFGYASGVARFFPLALFSAALGGALSLSGPNDLIGSGVYFLGMGMATVTSGLIALRGYLRNDSPAEGE